MSKYIEIDPGQEDDSDWSAISDFVTHVAQSNEEIDMPLSHKLESQPIKDENRREEQKSENYSYLINDLGKSDNNFQYIRREIGELLDELGEIRAARAGLQERLHNLNI